MKVRIILFPFLSSTNFCVKLPMAIPECSLHLALYYCLHYLLIFQVCVSVCSMYCFLAFVFMPNIYKEDNPVALHTWALIPRNLLVEINFIYSCFYVQYRRRVLRRYVLFKIVRCSDLMCMYQRVIYSHLSKSYMLEVCCSVMPSYNLQVTLSLRL